MGASEAGPQESQGLGFPMLAAGLLRQALVTEPQRLAFVVCVCMRRVTRSLARFQCLSRDRAPAHTPTPNRPLTQAAALRLLALMKRLDASPVGILDLSVPQRNVDWNRVSVSLFVCERDADWHHV